MPESKTATCDKCVWSTRQKLVEEETACHHEKVGVYIFHDNKGCGFYQAKPEPEVKPA